MKRTLISAATVGAALAFGSAAAAPINVGGVVWDPDDPIFDFSATDTMIETVVGDVGDVLSGYANILQLNGTGESTFCPSCELTYTFDSYTIISNSAGASGVDLVFNGGVINIYVDDTPNYSSTDPGSAADGDLFLSLVGALHYDPSTMAVGTLHSDPTPTATGFEGDGRGYLDVTGGLAAAYFDTDSQLISLDAAGTAGTADFLFTSSFQLLREDFTDPDTGITYGIFGSNDISGDSQRVPEPSTIALASLALLGMGAVGRKKRLG